MNDHTRGEALTSPLEPNPLGRIFMPDERDENYPMAAALPEAEVRGYRYWWQDGWWGDQQFTPQCVAYAWTHLLEDGPRTHAPLVPQRAAQHDRGAVVIPSEIYREAQQVDEWPGDSYSGTSVRAGAKVLHARGLLAEYRWASDVETVARALLLVGPVVVGTTWYAAMFHPNRDGEIVPEGDVVGGHAYVLNGVNTDREVFRVKNSWGRGWGLRGTAWISFDNFSRLLADHGEACLPIEA
ncbi:MAG: hypothetical protein KY469_10685 [Actinobacteria bacterium]|nr:hypothetical protein [Actinomycetota bacterium]